MRTPRIFAAVVLFLFLGLINAFAQSGYELFQQALVKERVEGNAEAALALYERIGKEHASNRELAAKALLQVGLLHEKLGHATAAQKAFETIVNRYSEFDEVAQMARTKLYAPPQAPADKPISVRQLQISEIGWLDSPSPDGRYLSLVGWEV